MAAMKWLDALIDRLDHIQTRYDRYRDALLLFITRTLRRLKTRTIFYAIRILDQKIMENEKRNAP
jgi:hypothetical protein